MLSMTVQDVIEVFDKLSANSYKRPDVPRDINVMARAYHEVLCRRSRESVLQAVREYIATDERRFWPTPGKLNTLAVHYGRPQPNAGPSMHQAFWDWQRLGFRGEGGDNREGLIPCPCCGHMPTLTGRLFPQCDPEAHYRAGLPVIGNVPAGVDVPSPAPPHDRGDAWEPA